MAEKEPGQRLFEMYMGANGRKYHVAPFCEVDPDRREEWTRAETAFEAPLLSEIERLKARVAELEAQVRPETTCVPTGAGDVDEVCSGCGHAVVDPHSWSECTRLLSAALTREMDGRLENERRTAELEAEREVIVAKLGEAVSLASLLYDMSGKWGYGETLATLKTYHASLAQERHPWTCPKCEQNAETGEECFAGSRFACPACSEPLVAECYGNGDNTEWHLHTAAEYDREECELTDPEEYHASLTQKAP